MATQAPQSSKRGSPLVIRGRDIREVTVCNVAAEPATRIYIPEDGCLIVELHKPGKSREPAPIMLQPGYANQGHAGQRKGE